MESLKGKTVLITGASSGIGRAAAIAFAEQGAGLILCARREELLLKLAGEIKEKFNVRIHTIKLDVRKKKEVDKAFSSLPDDFKEIDILLNNAGLARGFNKFYEDDPDGWEETIDTNVKGLLYVTYAVVPQMIERKSGHIINLGSIAGHEAYPKGAVYCASKYAVDAITKSLRMDLIDKNIRVSTIDPGSVETGFSIVRFYGDEAKAKNPYKGITPLVAEDIADAIIYVATRKPHVNIAQMIMYPTAQASATIFHRSE